MTRRWRWPLLFGTLGVGLALGWMIRPDTPIERPVWRTTTIGMEQNVSRIVSLSPSGRLAVVEVPGTEGTARIMNLQTGSVGEPLLYAANFTSRFRFSNDERWLLASSWGPVGDVFRIRVEDNEHTVVAQGGAAAWTADGSILFSDPADGNAIYRTNVDASVREFIVRPDSTLEHQFIGLLDPLPGTDKLLATGWAEDHAKADLILIDPGRGSYEVVKEDASSSYFTSSGHVVYVDGWAPGTVFVQRFDVSAGRFLGDPQSLGIGSLDWDELAVAENGDLAYSEDPKGDWSLSWYDPASGTTEDISLSMASPGQPSENKYGYFQSDDFAEPRVSPDGRRVAIARWEDGAGPFLFVLTPGGTGMPLQFFNEEPSAYPEWSADGQWLYYRTLRNGRPVVARKRSDRTGSEEVILRGAGNIGEPALSPDGRWLAVSESEGLGSMIWLVAVSDTTQMRRLGVGGDDYRDPAFSPDSRYVAFERRGRNAGLMVQDLETGELAGIQPTGSDQWNPAWSADGNFLYYKDAMGLWRVSVQLEPNFVSGPPERLRAFGARFRFGVHPDGRVLIYGPPRDRAGVTLIVNAATRYHELVPIEP